MTSDQSLSSQQRMGRRCLMAKNPREPEGRSFEKMANDDWTGEVLILTRSESWEMKVARLYRYSVI
jgi:hypothetical protein